MFLPSLQHSLHRDDRHVRNVVMSFVRVTYLFTVCVLFLCACAYVLLPFIARVSTRHRWPETWAIFPANAVTVCRPWHVVLSSISYSETPQNRTQICSSSPVGSAPVWYSAPRPPCLDRCSARLDKCCFATSAARRMSPLGTTLVPMPSLVTQKTVRPTCLLLR